MWETDIFKITKVNIKYPRLIKALTNTGKSLATSIHFPAVEIPTVIRSIFIWDFMMIEVHAMCGCVFVSVEYVQ